MLMRITTRTFASRLHLLNNGQWNTATVGSNYVLSYLKMLRTAARTEKNGARGVLVCSRCAARRGAVLWSLRGGPNQAPCQTQRILMPVLKLPSAMSGTIKPVEMRFPNGGQDGTDTQLR